MVCSSSRTLPGQGYSIKAFETLVDIASTVFLILMTTLLLRATLFLLMSITIDGSHPGVSIYKHYLKGRCYGSQYTGHTFCLSIGQHSALIEDRIGVAGAFIRQDTGGIWQQMRVSQRSTQYFSRWGMVRQP